MDYEIGKCEECLVKPLCDCGCQSSPGTKELTNYMLDTGRCIDCKSELFTYQPTKRQVLLFMCKVCGTRYSLHKYRDRDFGFIQRSYLKRSFEGEQRTWLLGTINDIREREMIEKGYGV